MDIIKGTLLGTLFSLVAIPLWVLIYQIGFIAGIAGALIGILFIFGYKKYNQDNPVSFYSIFVASVLIIAEIIIAEMIVIALAAAEYNVSINDALAISEVKTAVITDIIVGLLLSFVVFFRQVYIMKKNEYN